MLNRTLLFLLFPVLSFAQKRNSNFELNGVITGLPDSTKIYYEDAVNERVLFDSTLVINNKFRISGKAKNNAQEIFFYTKGQKDYTFFWIENSKMTFTAEYGKFKKAIITGSATQLENEDFQKVSTTNEEPNQKQAEISWIKEHPSSLISARILSGTASTWGRDTTELLYNILSKPNKETIYGKEIATFLKYNKNIKVGDKFVNFTEPDITGKKVSLSLLKVSMSYWTFGDRGV